MKLNNERSRDQKLKENEKCTNVMNQLGVVYGGQPHFTKICQIFISKMSTINNLTNHIMIPDPGIMERGHQ